MEELNPEFLSTIAQVSATFMGFALLTPIFQAVASGRKFPGERYISAKKFFMKWLLLLLLPLLILSYPLILSLFLLKLDTDFMDFTITNYYKFGSPLFGLGIFCYSIWIKKWSKLKGGRTSENQKKLNDLFRLTIELLPLLFIFLCLFMWFSLFFAPRFHSIKLILIFLVITGFSSILRNIGVEIDKGILFKETDISCEFENAKLEFVNKVERAKKERMKLIDKIDSFLRRYKNDEKLKEEVKDIERSIGYYKGEIENLERLKEKIEELYGEVTAKKDKITLDEFSEFDRRRIDGERRIEEFEAGTVVALNVLKRKYPENVYGVRWSDENDQE